MVCNGDEAMSRYAQGDAKAFEVVYDAVAPRLEAYLRRHVQDTARVEDLIQQTFMNMCGARGLFIIGAPVLPWALAIARRLMIDAGRKRREEPLDTNDEQLILRSAWDAMVPSGEQVVEGEQLRARLAAAYALLSGPQRAAFDLVKIEGMSQAEAASILGITVLGIKLRLYRVCRALRAALDDGDDHPPNAPASVARRSRRTETTASPLEVRR
jgi:RNA polymerase sigma-70 factor (ECF subfamily)